MTVVVQTDLASIVLSCQPEGLARRSPRPDLRSPPRVWLVVEATSVRANPRDRVGVEIADHGATYRRGRDPNWAEIGRHTDERGDVSLLRDLGDHRIVIPDIAGLSRLRLLTQQPTF